MGTSIAELPYPEDTVSAITYGTYVELTLNGISQSFFIGTHRLPGFESINDIEIISADSPLGSVLMGEKEKDTIIWELPNGKKMSAVILVINQTKTKEIYEQ